jgi:diamine N-acetyltransferase
MSIDPALVTLRAITAETVREIVKLSVRDDQKRFVADNAVSLSQALFAAEAWYRAIYLADEPVGFVMLYDESLRSSPPERPEVGVWRFMIDARFQGRGIGKAALERVVEHVCARNQFATLELSYVPGPGCPEPFYLALGFRHTGRTEDGEIVLERPLARKAS